LQTTGPYSLTLGTALEIPVPSAVTSYQAVAVANLSPYACQVNTENGPGQWLQPFSIDLFPLDQGGFVTVTPALVTPGSANFAQILTTWYTAADDLPGGYPISLTAQAVLAANFIQYLGTMVCPGNATTAESFTIPVGAQYIGVALQPTGVVGLVGTTDSLSVIGGTSGFNSITQNNIPWLALSGRPFYNGILLQTVDNQIGVSYTNSSTTGKVVTALVFAFASAPQADRIEQPTYVSVTDPVPLTPYTPFHTNVASGVGAVTILAAPATGNLWEVISVNVAATGATAASGLLVAGLTSGTMYWESFVDDGASFGIATSGGMPLAGPMYLKEGLTANQGSGVSVNFNVIARQVPSSSLVP
jgi:hypothetical protein